MARRQFLKSPLEWQEDNKRSSTSRKRNRDYDDDDDRRNPDFDSILDLEMEILSRLPVKSLVRFLCVSKLWASIIRRPDFVKSFTTRSSTQPRLLFSFRDGEKHVFFSSPYPQSGSVCVRNCDMMFSTVERSCLLYPIRSLICYGYPGQRLIINPSTKQTVTLPPNPQWRRLYPKNYFGYDPINDEYKVLCMSIPYCGEIFQCEEHHVLTLGAGQSWRRIEGTPHSPTRKKGLCINGILYYAALYGTKTDHNSVLVSFEVRSEKFNVIQVPEGIESFWYRSSTLINYKGKLARGHCNCYGITGVTLWVLDNAEKNEWSKLVFVFPTSVDALLGPTSFRVTSFYLEGTTDTGEFVLVPCISVPSYIFFYDPERNAIRKVEIEGIHEQGFWSQGDLYLSVLRISTDYVESIMFF